MKDELPLKCEYRDGIICIEIGKNVLRFAAENHPALWDGESDEPAVNITNVDMFIREVINEINREDEDGSSMLTDMLDTAIYSAICNGCDGIEQ